MLIAVSYRAGFGPVTRVKVKCASLKAGAPFRIDHRAVAKTWVAYVAMIGRVNAGFVNNPKPAFFYDRAIPGLANYADR